MKYPAFMFLLAIISFSCASKRQTNKADSINPVIGNISYEKKFGTKPGAGTDETIRIQTHLAYVEDLLRSKDVSHLPDNIRDRRAKMLNLLHDYRTAARFPANYDHPGERKPCFIDKTGNICAVGYLVEQTAGRALAEKINRQHQYDKIADMKTPELLAWVDNSGLTADECAMIQPQYGNSIYYGYENPNYVKTGDGIATAVWSGLNLSLAATSSIRMISKQPAKTVSLAGIFSGAGQMFYGALTIPEKKSNWEETNNAQRTVSFVNIGVGATCVFVNAFNYFSKKQNDKNSYGVYSFPTYDNKTGVAFTYTRKL